MKNQYFGDINDYHKYALLRALLKGGKIKLLVAWMLTNDDNGPDGNKRRFLKNVKKKWRELDPDLFDFLLALHDCIFRSKAATRFGPIRPPISESKRPPVSDQSGHLCRLVC
jgi:hypothetical protein